MFLNIDGIVSLTIITSPVNLLKLVISFQVNLRLPSTPRGIPLFPFFNQALSTYPGGKNPPFFTYVSSRKVDFGEGENVRPETKTNVQMSVWEVEEWPVVKV